MTFTKQTSTTAVLLYTAKDGFMGSGSASKESKWKGNRREELDNDPEFKKLFESENKRHQALSQDYYLAQKVNKDDEMKEYANMLASQYINEIDFLNIELEAHIDQFERFETGTIHSEKFIAKTKELLSPPHTKEYDRTEVFQALRKNNPGFHEFLDENCKLHCKLTHLLQAYLNNLKSQKKNNTKLLASSIEKKSKQNTKEILSFSGPIDATKQEIKVNFNTIKLKLLGAGIRGKEANSIPVCDWALEHASKKEHFDMVVHFSKVFCNNILINDYENQGIKAWKLISEADPSLFFDFCRKPILEINQTKELSGRSLKYMEGKCPNRKNQHKEILSSLFRKMSGAPHTNAPLLIGGPGTGKTHQVITLAKGLTALGMKTDWGLQSMAQAVGPSSGEATEIQMNLLGSDAHWSNGRPGFLYEKGMRPDTKIVITILDEADKAPGMRNLMINLLDPDQILQDNFISSFVPEMDMRHKVFFVLTSNDTESLQINDADPLWSRIRPVNFPDYSKQEMIEVITAIAVQELKKLYGVPVQKCHEIIQDCVESAGQGQSFRKILDDITHQAFQYAVPELRGDGKVLGVPARRQIGF